MVAVSSIPVTALWVRGGSLLFRRMLLPRSYVVDVLMFRGSASQPRIHVKLVGTTVRGLE